MIAVGSLVRLHSGREVGEVLALIPDLTWSDDNFPLRVVVRWPDGIKHYHRPAELEEVAQ